MQGCVLSTVKTWCEGELVELLLCGSKAVSRWNIVIMQADEFPSQLGFLWQTDSCSNCAKHSCVLWDRIDFIFLAWGYWGSSRPGDAVKGLKPLAKWGVGMEELQIYSVELGHFVGLVITAIRQISVLSPIQENWEKNRILLGGVRLYVRILWEFS